MSMKISWLIAFTIAITCEIIATNQKGKSLSGAFAKTCNLSKDVANCLPIPNLTTKLSANCSDDVL